MQRVLLLRSIGLLIVFALYACSSTAPNTPIKPVPATPVKPMPPAAVIENPASVPRAVETPAPASGVPAVPAEVKPAVLPTEKPFPHIALLLPLQSPVFGTSADAVQQGFFAAANYKNQGLPVRVYSNFEENSGVVAAYRQAIANGALAVVGPLTRNGVGALAAEKDIPVPTLALNMVEGQVAPKLFFFGMAVEAEARQVAQLAKQQGMHQAIIITTHTQLSQRLQAAFEEEWTGPDNGMAKETETGILREIEYNDDPSALADIGDITDTMVFLAIETEKARLLHPYLPNKLPVYAISQIFVSNGNSLVNYDLNGIRFVDMPWLLQPDHPAVMIYPRSNPPLPADRERLYALGIDSYRLIQLMLSNKVGATLPLDGVSGQITLNGHNFQHMAIPAVFAQGHAQLPNAPATPAAQIFPGQVSNTEQVVKPQ